MKKGRAVTVSADGGRLFKYRVTIRRDEDDVFIAECPTLPGCVTDGATFEEALAMIKDAIRVYIGAKLELGENVPADDEVFDGYVTVSV